MKPETDFQATFDGQAGAAGGADLGTDASG